MKTKDTWFDVKQCKNQTFSDRKLEWYKRATIKFSKLFLFDLDTHFSHEVIESVDSSQEYTIRERFFYIGFRINNFKSIP